MSLLIKNWQMADWKELLKWAKIGANNAMIGEFTEVEEIQPHGRLIDADELQKQLEYLASLEWNQRVGASPGIECAIDMLDDAQTIIPAEPKKEEMK